MNIKSDEEYLLEEYGFTEEDLEDWEEFDPDELGLNENDYVVVNVNDTSEQIQEKVFEQNRQGFASNAMNKILNTYKGKIPTKIDRFYSSLKNFTKNDPFIDTSFNSTVRVFGWCVVDKDKANKRAGSIRITSSETVITAMDFHHTLSEIRFYSRTTVEGKTLPVPAQFIPPNSSCVTRKPAFEKGVSLINYGRR